MNIDDMKLKDIKAIAAMFSSEPTASTSPHIGKKCIIRTYASGVHFGTLLKQVGRQVELASARRLWRWDTAPHGISLSEVAIHGPVGKRSKICSTVPEMSILDALEVIPCTAAAIDVIESAEVSTP